MFSIRCRHSRNIPYPSFVFGLQSIHPVVPICASCFYSYMTSTVTNADQNFDLLFVQQAIVTNESTKQFSTSDTPECENISLSLNGDCLLTSFMHSKNEESFSIIFNLFTFALDCVILPGQGVNFCLPAEEDKFHTMSNESLLKGRSLNLIQDVSKRFFIVNDTHQQPSHDSSSSDEEALELSYSSVVSESSS